MKTQNVFFIKRPIFRPVLSGLLQGKMTITTVSLRYFNNYKQHERVQITANIVRAARQKLRTLPTFTILRIEKIILI